jgi:hypothetical protein
VPLSLGDARRLVGGYVRHSNEARLHGAIGYVTPAAKIAGQEATIFAERDRKLEAARERRKNAREAARQAVRGARPLGPSCLCQGRADLG